MRTRDVRVRFSRAFSGSPLRLSTRRHRAGVRARRREGPGWTQKIFILGIKYHFDTGLVNSKMSIMRFSQPHPSTEPTDAFAAELLEKERGRAQVLTTCEHQRDCLSLVRACPTNERTSSRSLALSRTSNGQAVCGSQKRQLSGAVSLSLWRFSNAVCSSRDDS